MKSHLTRKIVGSIRHFGNLRRVPALSVIFVGDSNDGTVALHRDQIEHSIIVRVGDRNRFDEWQSRWERTLAELALPLIHEYVKPSRAVDDRGIGVTVAIQIGPCEPEHARDSGKRMNG